MTVSLSKISALWLLSASVALAQAPHETTVVTQVQATADDDSDDNPAPTIEVGNISKPSLESTGLLDASNGGLSSDIWKNGTRATGENLLLSLHSGGITDETVRNLTLRLLVTQADPPPGPGTHDWFMLRVETLMLLGQDEKAEAMIAAVPASLQTSDLRILRAELLLIRSDTTKACEVAPPATPDANRDNDLFWQKLSITCKAVQGKMNEALVGIDLLRETYHMDDLFFLDAIHAIGDKKNAIKSMPKKWDLFNVALVRLAGQTDKLKDKLDQLPPIAVKYLAQDGSADIKLRERATMRAELWGLVPMSGVSTSPELPFTSSVASDVKSLVRALSGTDAPSDSDNRIIARLAIDENVTQDTRRLGRLLSIMEQFGYVVPPAIWQKLWPHRYHIDAELPSVSLLARLEDAAHAKRNAEVIILSALISGNNATEKESEYTLVPVMRALIACGYTIEARQIAARAVKNYGTR